MDDVSYLSLIKKIHLYFFLLSAGCSPKLQYLLYATPDEYMATGERKLYLFANGKYYLHINFLTENINHWNCSMGTYQRENDSCILLSSEEKALELKDCIQGRIADTMYQIEIADKRDTTLHLGEKYIINGQDTLSDVARYALHYIKERPYVHTIAIWLPAFGYTSPVQKVDSCANYIKLRFNMARYFFYNDFIFMDRYHVHIKNDSVVEVVSPAKDCRPVSYPLFTGKRIYTEAFVEETWDNYRYDYLVK